MPVPDPPSPAVAPAAGIGVDAAAVVDRIALDARSWVDVARGWVHGADELFDALLGGVAWQSSRLFRYDHWVEERRLGSFWARGRGHPLPHPALAPITQALQRRYKVLFDGFGLLQYRDGSDGQAFHRDTDMRWLDDTVIAVVSLGARRPWQLRPRADRRHADSPGKGATHDLAPGPGDLIVMGGRCQADWEHSVPYLPAGRPVGTRISLQWRHARRVGRPFAGGSYRDPLHFDVDG
ncbi:MAG TPA: alpha-ketoglutarate-dependent dioxygenase AlkB [Acidimicrobiales bacterium]|nr:alpha-ketoglutarate-dependent dioxygenase AlkB [Acidimicrobiales bacterium]